MLLCILHISDIVSSYPHIFTAALYNYTYTYNCTVHAAHASYNLLYSFYCVNNVACCNAQRRQVVVRASLHELNIHLCMKPKMHGRYLFTLLNRVSAKKV